MVTDYKKMDLFGETLIQKIVLKPPFEFPFPVSDRACFLFSLEGDIQFYDKQEQFVVHSNYSLLLTCISNGKKIINSANSTQNELIIISFYPGTLKKIYERDLPLLLQKPKNNISNQSAERINNDFLIKKYIEGLLFYFENPSLVNEDLLIIKLKEIILLLSQTQNAETIRVILSQLFSPATYSFRQIIDANMFRQVGIEELAKKTNLSVSSFKREFTKLYNDSPANYIKTKRLERAAELLVVSDERITDIAFDCGFNDLANFTKSFHDKFNVTPTNYRLKLK
ncbi:helix-turn-helix transcriptional regulator [Flavobacterium zepuense]|uniref:Helix-turn-helix transcriptional regulator n=1 Tax=Flavobacterium zepuense TaxID=2593302 RepID=A0A552VAQ6_9FLAO|nr:AraC family transcriptional regulator [Flavobacterium zepuense]TRW27529.1 helix-turn-helix transcriptional regulator [Flavobacterium zepuense]